MPDGPKPESEPTTAALLEQWRVAERAATASERAAIAAERAAAAAERAAGAAERVGDAALLTVEVAREALDVVRASVVEARAAAGTSLTESATTSEDMRDAQDASAASRERYQERIAGLRARKEGGPDATPDKTDMGAVGDDGQVFGG